MSSKCFNKNGNWFIYTLGLDGPIIDYVSDDPIDILIKINNFENGSVMFCPNNMKVKEALKWWEKEKIKYDNPSVNVSPFTRTLNFNPFTEGRITP